MCAPDSTLEPDRVGVFLNRRLGDHFGRLMQPGINHLEAGVAQRAGDNLGATIVAVEAWFRDDDSEPFVCH